MQSTGHSSTHALSFTSMQGSAITYAIPGTFQSWGPNPQSTRRRRCLRVREAQDEPMDVRMLRSAGTKLTTAAVVVGVLAALVPATTALATVSASPPPGTGPGMAYDAADGQVVLFGGSTRATWTWDGSGWTRRT